MSEQHQHQVRVTYRRQLSDGRYGTEAAELSLEDWTVDDDELLAELLLLQAARLVNRQLAQSQSAQVRSAASPPPTQRSAEVRVPEDEAPF